MPILLERPGGPSTMQIVVERMKIGSEPGNRPDLWGKPDNFIIDLALAGGGRGGTEVVARQVKELRDAGNMINPGYNGIRATDRITAQSGSITVGLFAAAERGDGQVERGLQVFRDLDNSDFFSWRRIYNGIRRRGTPAMDLRVLIDIISNRNKIRLPFERLAGGGMPVIAYVTGVDGTVIPVELTSLSEEDILQTNYVGATFPVMAGEPQPLPDGRKGLDGGIGTPGPPIEHSQRALILRREPPGTREKSSWLYRWAAGHLGADYPGLIDPLLTWPERFNTKMELLDQLGEELDLNQNFETTGPPKGSPFVPTMRRRVNDAIVQLGGNALKDKFLRYAAATA